MNGYVLSVSLNLKYLHLSLQSPRKTKLVEQTHSPALSHNTIGRHVGSGSVQGQAGNSPKARVDATEWHFEEL